LLRPAAELLGLQAKIGALPTCSLWEPSMRHTACGDCQHRNLIGVIITLLPHEICYMCLLE